jgi:serine/threonine protein kinase
MAANRIGALRSALASPPMAAAPRQLGNIKKLGQGGFGAVFLFGHKKGEVARKYFNDEKHQVEEYNSIRFCKSLDHHPGHSNVIKAIRTGYYSQEKMHHYYIDYELAIHDLYVEAYTRRMEHFRTAESVRNMVFDCVSGLDFLHTQVHINHNDIKALNILVCRTDSLRRPCVCKISDLGLATKIAISGDARPYNAFKPRLGTFGYVAPELFVSDHYLIAPTYEKAGVPDVFGMGVALFSVVEGREVMRYPPEFTALLNEHFGGKRVWSAVCQQADRFVNRVFYAPTPNGDNVLAISKRTRATISLMCSTN